MFDTLSGKLQRVFKDLRGLGKISEENIGAALRDVRLALLDADVNFKVARDFIERIKEKSLGQEVLLSIQPGRRTEVHRGMNAWVSDVCVLTIGTNLANSAKLVSCLPLHLLRCATYSFESGRDARRRRARAPASRYQSRSLSAQAPLSPPKRDFSVYASPRRPAAFRQLVC